MVQKHFEVMHARAEQPMALLYASMAAIYQRFGYAVISTRNIYKIEPRYLLFPKAHGASCPSGRLREVEDQEFDLLRELYRSFCKDRIGYLHCGRSTWQAGPLLPLPKRGGLFRIAYEENAEPLGYVIYTVEPRPVPQGQAWQQIHIRDLAWLTPAAYRAIWGYFAQMDLALEIAWMRVPVDDPLPHLLLEPRKLNLNSGDGLLARIVDVTGAAACRQYDAEGRSVRSHR